MTLRPSHACPCEERSDAAIRNPLTSYAVIPSQ